VLGCGLASADKKLYGEHAVNLQCARIIASDLEAGDTEAAALFFAPIDAATIPGPVPHWTEAIHSHNLCDAGEDCAQAEWIRNTSDDNLDRYIRKLAIDIRNAEILLKALERERDERRDKR
jgi:hypothetical protein